jgi:hypothetical protein
MTTRRPAPATDGCTLLLGAVLLFQGVGRLAGAEQHWFVVDYLPFLRGNELLSHVAFAAIGLAVLVAAGLPDELRRSPAGPRHRRR